MNRIQSKNFESQVFNVVAHIAIGSGNYHISFAAAVCLHSDSYRASLSSPELRGGCSTEPSFDVILLTNRTAVGDISFFRDHASVTVR